MESSIYDLIRRGLPDHNFICHECTFPICIIVTVHQRVVMPVCVGVGEGGGGGGRREMCMQQYSECQKHFLSSGKLQ